ncbi:2-succinyl-5-enolpyruvyl-6-hydroxy-3-cyclohexene-1-carboxylic-acid synthase [Phycicoccus sp. M110.8]|uniref:2-succinyl-5-enolpyruvyl-6-hydroxy-3- cyclohexene-1-carboxylic-acid synthase n=1 Tax=Phycicoccus sp. M110.8 TaxID=3075433 RepID=UPI0028FDBF55|nr:2-succinyl-5-enolpyruvyl-6-hydroxy-3-cyclohexene-1-carboxylic-acid synthase [Phycicoccus sp. M110.8]MDU0314294.1 2-succinyl-5-enolpyruvyl-6-hydroxy-3-cyclohexene-1-carboxylic-acid synthase [Phycicoccus sp. M110.8]
MNPSTALATVVVDELVRQGVRHVVLCPGSRSAPFAYAVLAAERAGRLTMHVRVDERSAGFLAVGLAKLTRVPAVVVTTSGTAVANLHPAVLEAHHGVVPLVVLSADRPVELRGTGANQTTTQPGMFADAVHWSADLAAPQAAGADEAAAEAVAWRRAAREAVAAATGAGVAGTRTAGALRGTEPGPVHLNVQLREPLVPTDEPAWPGPLEPLADPADAAPAVEEASPTAAGARPSGQLAAVDREPARTLVVVGDLPEPGQLERAVRWATSHGWPVLAEPFGPHPRDGVLPHGHLVLADPDWLDAHAPERVVTVGRLTLSRPVSALLRRPGTRVEAVGTHAWVRARPSVAVVHPAAVLDHLGDVGGASAETDWAREWRSAGERVAAALDGTGPAWPSGGAVARTVLEALPGGATLFLGSSNSVRDVDVAAGRHRGGPVTVAASRGLAGIDGCVSTASGLALAGAAPAYALMGDLTFLHDSNGLLVGPLERHPDLTVVVVNDDGGGIFTLLEPGAPELARDFERVFGTPTGTDLAALCAAHGVRHVVAGDAAELAGLVAEEPAGTTVVEVRLDRSRHRDEGARLTALAREALQSG